MPTLDTGFDGTMSKLQSSKNTESESFGGCFDFKVYCNNIDSHLKLRFQSKRISRRKGQTPSAMVSFKSTQPHEIAILLRLESYMYSQTKRHLDFFKLNPEIRLAPIFDKPMEAAYKDHLYSMLDAKCLDLMPASFMQRHSINPQSQFACIDGLHLNIRLLGYHGQPTMSRHFRIYLVNDRKKLRRILECTCHDNTRPVRCGHTTYDFHKLFDHLRSHTKERPFVCTMEGCSKSFT